MAGGRESRQADAEAAGMGRRVEAGPRRVSWTVRREVGFALYLAQIGTKAVKTKPLKSFGGAGVLEVIADHDGNTYRAVYTVRFAEVVYVPHAFQKKFKRGAPLRNRKST